MMLMRCFRLSDQGWEGMIVSRTRLQLLHRSGAASDRLDCPRGSASETLPSWLAVCYGATPLGFNASLATHTFVRTILADNNNN